MTTPMKYFRSWSLSFGIAPLSVERKLRPSRCPATIEWQHLLQPIENWDSVCRVTRMIRFDVPNVSTVSEGPSRVAPHPNPHLKYPECIWKRKKLSST